MSEHFGGIGYRIGYKSVPLFVRMYAIVAEQAPYITIVVLECRSYVYYVGSCDLGNLEQGLVVHVMPTVYYAYVSSQPFHDVAFLIIAHEPAEKREVVF